MSVSSYFKSKPPEMVIVFDSSVLMGTEMVGEDVSGPQVGV